MVSHIPDTHAHKCTSWKVGLVRGHFTPFAHKAFTPLAPLMATMQVASTGTDRSLEKQGWKSPRLPEIVHPMQRAGDRSSLAVRGLSSRQSANKDAHGELNLDVSSRPATCPENNFGRGTSRAYNSRPATSLGPSTSAVHLGVDEVLDTAT